MSKLIGSNIPNQTYYFESDLPMRKGGSGDNRKDYKNFKKKFGPDWYYYNKEVSYVMNEKGFRERSFNDVDWSNSIVILGDSCVSGTGNTLEDTISKQMEKILDGIPVINLGVSGTSIEFSCFNSLALFNNYPRPKAIVQVWTGLHRYIELTPEKNSINYTIHLPTRKNNYCMRHNWLERNKLYVEYDRTIWSNKIPRVEASFNKDTAEKLNVNFLKTIDLARDNDHPGYKSNKLAAKIIVENLEGKI